VATPVPVAAPVRPAALTRAPFGRIALGAGLTALATLPLLRILARPETGLAGAATAAMADG
jgi:hypothetical protein